MGFCGLAIAAAARRSLWSLQADLRTLRRNARALPSEMLEERMAAERVEGVWPVRSVRAAVRLAGSAWQKQPLAMRYRTRSRYEVSGSRRGSDGGSILLRSSVA